MGIFSAILDKLRGRATQSQTQPSIPGSEGASGGVARTSEQAQQQTGTAEQMQARAQAGQQAAAQAGVQPAGSASSAGMLQDVDIEAVLAQMASQKKGGGGNYRQSIVDLLKLLDLDSSLPARKELAEELGVQAGAHGSAEQNVALHKAVMRNLAENGGKVPASLRD